MAFTDVFKEHLRKKAEKGDERAQRVLDKLRVSTNINNALDESWEELKEELDGEGKADTDR